MLIIRYVYVVINVFKGTMLLPNPNHYNVQEAKFIDAVLSLWNNVYYSKDLPCDEIIQKYNIVKLSC